MRTEEDQAYNAENVYSSTSSSERRFCGLQTLEYSKEKSVVDDQFHDST